MVFSTVRFWRLRKLIRDSTRPIPLSKAKTWDRRLQATYNILALVGFVGVMKAIYTHRQAEEKEKGPLSETDAEYYVRTLNLQDVHVTRVTLGGKITFSEKIRDAADFKQRRLNSVPGASRVPAKPAVPSESVNTAAPVSEFSEAPAPDV